MRLDLGHAGDADGDVIRHASLCRDIHHRQRAPDQARLGIGRPEHARRHGAGNAKFVHSVRGHAGEIGHGVKALDNAGRQQRQIQHAEGIGGEFSEGLLGHRRTLTAGSGVQQAASGGLYHYKMAGPSTDDSMPPATSGGYSFTVALADEAGHAPADGRHRRAARARRPDHAVRRSRRRQDHLRPRADPPSRRRRARSRCRARPSR